jgi:hypothetical protein
VTIRRVLTIAWGVGLIAAAATQLEAHKYWALFSAFSAGWLLGVEFYLARNERVKP